MKWLATGLSLWYLISTVFFKAGIKCMSCFADVQFATFSTMNYIHNVKSQTIEMFGNILGIFRSLDLDEGT